MNVTGHRSRSAVVCLSPVQSGGSLFSSLELVKTARRLGHTMELFCVSEALESASRSTIEYLGDSYGYVLIPEAHFANELASGDFHRVIASTTSVFPIVHKAASQAGVPFITIVRGGTYGPGTGFSGPELEAVLAAEQVACVSRALQRQLAADCGRNAVLLQTPLPIRPDPLQRPNISPLLIYAGRFSQRKNTHLISAIASRLIELGIRSTVTLLGDGPEKEPLAHKLAELPVEVKSGPWSPHAGVLTAMRECDFLIAPSAREGRPRIVLEAIAAGTIPLMSAIPAHTEFFTSKADEFTWPIDQPSRAADLIARLLRSPAVRTQFWESLGESSHRASQRHFSENIDAMLGMSISHGFSSTRLSGRISDNANLHDT